MKPNLKALLWAVVLAAGFLFAGSLPAHAGNCSSVCTPNTRCILGCTVNFALTTCGQSGFPCCSGSSSSATLYCTGQYLNSSNQCVQVARQMITTTYCDGFTTTSFHDNTQTTSGGTCANCPTQYTSGCSDLATLSKC